MTWKRGRLMFCSQCGSQISDGAGFCPMCGAKVGGGPAAPQPSPVVPEEVDANSSPVQSAQVVPVPPASTSPTGDPASGAVPVDASRSLLIWVLLSFITCGLYTWYFVYTLAVDMNRMCQGDNDETPGLLVFILLSIVTCGFYSYWWYYKIGNRMQANAPRYGLQFQENGTTILLWMIFGVLLCGIGPFVAMHILIKNVNALAAAYNARLVRA